MRFIRDRFGMQPRVHNKPRGPTLTPAPLPQRDRGDRAFTLVELMVVVVIIGVMATVVTVQVSDYLVTAKQNVARSELATIKSGLELFFMENDRYPTTDEGLSILTKRTTKHPNGILSSDLTDPWGRDYLYVYPGVSGPYELRSLGADGQEGGVGANMDVALADAQEKEPVP